MTDHVTSAARSAPRGSIILALLLLGFSGCEERPERNAGGSGADAPLTDLDRRAELDSAASQGASESGPPAPLDTSTPDASKDGALKPPPGKVGIAPCIAGYGTEGKAGRGGSVIKVTNLNTSGSGSLQACIDATGSRTCVFEVGGLIDYSTSVKIKNPYITIAGQTAPEPGITILGGPLSIQTSEVFVQHIRIFPGDGAGNAGYVRDGVSIAGKVGSERRNIVLDHLTVAFTVDENMEVYYQGDRVSGVTLSNNMHVYPLNCSIHDEGCHGFGPLVSGDPRDQSDQEYISFVRNLFALGVGRHPRINDTRAEVINNFVYGARQRGLEAELQKGHDPGWINIINNVFRASPDHVSYYSNCYIISTPVHAKGNDGDAKKLVGRDACEDRGPATPYSPMSNYSNSIIPTAKVSAFVLAHAGARPKKRYVVEKTAAAHAKNGTGKVIDKPTDLGADVWDSYKVKSTRPVSSIGLPSDPNGDANKDGYTNLENWLHDLDCQVGGNCAGQCGP